jgi:hypothetical protein
MPLEEYHLELAQEGFLVARTLILLGFCSLALAQSQPGVDWRFAHPDADMKMSLNVQALVNSPSVTKAIEQAKSPAKDNATQIQFALALLQTFDRISVSVRQKTPLAGKALAGKPAADMDVLVQVTGTFDPQLMAGLFPSTGASKVKVVGPHTLLIGEGDSFARAAERIAAGAPEGGDELEQSDFWVAANYAFLAQQANGAKQPLPPLFQSLRDVSIGLNFGGLHSGEAPEVNLLLTASGAAGAGEILKTFQDAVVQLAQATPMASAAAKALNMKQEGSVIRLHFVVPPELVAFGQQVAQQQAAASGGLPAQLLPLLGTLGLGQSNAAAPAATPMPPPPQNGGKIVIYGLDDGPKEIVLPK